MADDITLPQYPFVHVDVPVDAVELVSLSLFELGALGVEERDGTTFTRPDAAAACTLIGSFADVGAAEFAVASLAEDYSARVTFVTGDDWRHRWKTHFKPLRVGERLVIRPSWEEFEAKPGDVVLTLDPGGAFGTGTHESTRLVLKLLQERSFDGERVFDVGCGSGILTVAALLLGAGHAVAIDVDPASAEATEENAQVNGVRDRVEASTTPLAEFTERFPLVISNIEAHILIPLADSVCARVAGGGELILSGILTHQGDAVVEAYAPLKCVRREEEGEWVALAFEKAK